MTDNRRNHQRSRSRQKRQRRRKIQKAIWLELTVVIALVSFLAGRKVGETKGYEIAAGEQQAYQAGSQLEDDYVNGEVSRQPQQEEEIEDKPYLILVNKENKLPDDYELNLKVLPDNVNKASDLAYEPLLDMLNAGRKEGLRFEICSSYRSVERQQELLDEDIDELMRRGYSYKDAYSEVTRETMPPGYSEHSTGLAFDIVSLDYQMLDAKQANTKETKWLQKHCAEYGFILRYPDDKEDVTGISYESWHYRYVGEEAAAYIMENGITLEEYLEGI